MRSSLKGRGTARSVVEGFGAVPGPSTGFAGPPPLSAAQGRIR
jgi:hypothetical protein